MVESYRSQVTMYYCACAFHVGELGYGHTQKI